MFEASTTTRRTSDTPPPALRRLLGEAAATFMPAGVSPYPLLRVPADTTLVHEGGLARTIYLVQAGHFKTVMNCEDGYEQVLDFVQADGLLGCDGLADGRYASGAVALEDAWVVALPAVEIQRVVQQEPAFAARWQAAMAQQIVRAGVRTWVMSAVGSEKRLARFLVKAMQRQADRGESPHRLRLPMCRRDLGSHLGLSHESVSRSFTLLDAAGLLRVNNREVEVLDAKVLRSFASSTRGYAALRRGACASGARADCLAASAAGCA
ncbi:Crp/Fnr family transcriptional regulator [Rubrivivax sp. RP6-9]|uniref:Crp/Fnr family transcriptional regulator n=1 Tax=Rubrivivax sp. RP6-9 TaxID=3415750 RepID=UPI003CC59579